MAETVWKVPPPPPMLPTPPEPPTLTLASSVEPPRHDEPDLVPDPRVSLVEIEAGVFALAQASHDWVAPRLATAWKVGRTWVQTLAQASATPPPAVAQARVPALVEPNLPRTATVIVRMPSSQAELVVKGPVGRGNPDEWYGPRRVIHSPPLTTAQDYRIGAFWTNPDGQPVDRSRVLRVEPGHLYEVDLRSDKPTAVEVNLPPTP